MLIIVELSEDAFSDPPSLARLAAIAAEYELLLICPQHATGGDALPTLRRALPRHQVIALLVDDDVALYERELVHELLEGGRVPLLVTRRDPPVEAASWVEADARLALPDSV